MRKIVVGMHAGIVGTDAWEFYLVPDEVTDEELGDFAWCMGVDHASSYGIYPRNEYEECEDISEEELYGDSYSDNIEGWFEEYVPEKHDMKSHTGTPSWHEY